jgi:glycyl-tRNA synthetase beta chain
MKHADFLVELLIEELPPKSLLALGKAFETQVTDRLQKAGLTFDGVVPYITPRRLALLVKQLASTQPQQNTERRGPAVSAAFKDDGTPTPACLGFARSCGVEVSALHRIQTSEGEWMGYHLSVEGKSVAELLPLIITESLAALPIAKRMRWGSTAHEFVRPVRGLVMLYGEDIIPATILGCVSGRETVGHRFHAPSLISIPKASAYADVLLNQGKVMADASARLAAIETQLSTLLKPNEITCALSRADLNALMNEVVGLVEWPVALRGSFDVAFLSVPKEVLISSMIDHQRYFPIADKTSGKLLPAFITISNIESRESARVVHGNERVLRARLSDAAFFYDADKKETLSSRLPRLNTIVYQAKLGSLGEKAERLSKLAAYLANGGEEAARAGLLAKADLVTGMVGEFPELQGVMGAYYAENDKEASAVALAIREHYLPRFSGDVLPSAPTSLAVALADRLDLLVGYFGINQLPTGDKDPYGLRRAALGVVRLLIETEHDLDLNAALSQAAALYQNKLANKAVVADVLGFIQERLRPYYQERGIAQDVVASVTALGLSNLHDVDKRIAAVQAFKSLEAAAALSAANKRVSNILAKYPNTLDGLRINTSLFENEAETALANLVQAKETALAEAFKAKQYQEALTGLAELRQPVDVFFESVMVMTDDQARRDNRLALLGRLRHLFLQVADIALLT